MIDEQFFLLGILYLLVELLGISSAFHTILNTRTSQAAIAWAITLITLPLLALPLYWIFGSSRFRGYLESFRRARLHEIETAEKTLQEIKKFHSTSLDDFQDILSTINHLGILPFTSSNSVQLLINGQKTYKAMIEAIERAQDYVLLQFYIVHNDHVGETFRNILTRKMTQGVKVYFLYDELGSHKLSFRYLQELRNAGAHVSGFNGQRGFSKYLHINFRNHRKILIVDGFKAFVGGLNLGLEYLGEDTEMGYWRDTHVLLEGPTVQVMQTVFVKDWYWSVGQIPELNWIVKAADINNKKQTQCRNVDLEKQNFFPKLYNQNILLLDTGPADIKPVCSLFLSALINHAKKRLWIATPYFVPDPELIHALKNAALRGVDIRLILPEKHDSYLVYLTSFAYYQELQGYNIKIYRYTKGFSHQKVILIDDNFSGIGTLNFDNRSIHLNFEVVAYVADTVFNQQVAQMLEYDMKNCYLDNLKNFETRPFWFKLISRLFYLLSPVL
jgi:cardiolipin synthase A/B